MKIKTTKAIKLKLNGNDADRFKSIIKKLNQDNIGFKQWSLSDEELQVVKSLHEKLSEDERS